MKIQMTKTGEFCIDGFRLARLEKGQEYDLRESAACRLINKGHATYVKPEVEHDVVAELISSYKKRA